jgi:hypothetical protein
MLDGPFRNQRPLELFIICYEGAGIRLEFPPRPWYRYLKWHVIILKNWNSLNCCPGIFLPTGPHTSSFQRGNFLMKGSPFLRPVRILAIAGLVQLRTRYESVMPSLDSGSSASPFTVCCLRMVFVLGQIVRSVASLGLISQPFR